MEKLVICLLVVHLLLAFLLKLDSAKPDYVDNLVVSGSGTYNGFGSVFGDSCFELQSEIICTQLAAADGDTGPSSLSVNLTSKEDINHFIIWNKMSASAEQSLQVGFKSSPEITFNRVLLHFLNYPNENIGLPNISLPHYKNQSIPFTRTGLETLSADDKQVRSVALDLSSSIVSKSFIFQITISFAGMDNIDWFFLSEVSFGEAISVTFQEPLSDNIILMPSVSSLDTVTLNCSVEGSETYLWLWLKDQDTITDGGRYKISNEARKTQLTISQLRYSDAGQYICEVKLNEQATFSNSKSIQLQLPAVVSIGDTIRTLCSVTLTCELHGYLHDESAPQWYRVDSTTPLSSGSKYSIMTSHSGTRPTQSSTGTSVAGVVVVLTINALEVEDAGQHMCQYSATGAQSFTSLSVLPDSGVLEANAKSILRELGKSAELSCELYGYLNAGTLTVIYWHFDGVPLDPSLIQVQQGGHMIQNGGASPIPSVRSVVTLHNLNASMFGTYSCHSGAHLELINLELMATQPTSLPNCGNESGLIAGVVVAVSVVVATAIVIATILAIWIIKRRNRPTPVNEKPNSGPVYEEVLKPASETVHTAANLSTPSSPPHFEVDAEATHIELHAEGSHGQTTTPVELQGNPCYGTK